MKIKREDIRNIAIIAHVDHGKTTLVLKSILSIRPDTQILAARWSAS